LDLAKKGGSDKKAQAELIEHLSKLSNTKGEKTKKKQQIRESLPEGIANYGKVKCGNLKT
jgi:hypothetical protein